MNDVTTIAIDLAKNIFHLVGINGKGKPMFKKKLTRDKLIPFLANQQTCTIAMEACSGANHWARRCRQIGHDAKLINPQYVKPYLKTNKNDWNDAEAIAEASTRPTMRFVPVKTIEQQDIQTIHRSRSQYMKQRNATSNHIRGVLAEYGLVIGKGVSNLLKALPEILEDTQSELSELFKENLRDLHEHFIYLVKKVKQYDARIDALADSNDTCQRLMLIGGVGAKTATIMVSTLSEPHLFKNGREVSAYLGLVPKQHSSGGKDRLLGISKRGDRYIRCLLIQGARSALIAWKQKKSPTPIQSWAQQLLLKKSFNKVAVALANKNARMIWAILANDSHYDPCAHEGCAK